jgi:hypothetical protein
MKSGKSLKAASAAWLVSLVAFDILVLFVFVFPDVIGALSITELTVARATLALVLPVAVLLLSGVLSHRIKASLVYWKIANALPGYAAFTRHGPEDARIDMAALQKNIGNLPTIPAEQNRLWFKFFKAVETEPAVVEAHKMYLLYRDMAAISLLLLIAVPAALYLHGAAVLVVAAVAGMFAVQYLMAALAARHKGIRFVTNVLAVHTAEGGARSGKSPGSRKRKS